MAYKLQLKRGASGSLPTGSAGEPLFTTDTNDLYIGTGSGNQRYQKYIASGTSAQFLKGDGSLDSNTYYLASNPSAFIALTALTASAPLSYNNTTGAFTISQASGSVNGFLSSTDWTTFNNKQNALTNPVTGTGTTNYLPKWISGSAIGNSLAQDTGSSINIGTATTYPATKLVVGGASAIGGIVSEDTAGTGSFVRILGDATSGNLINYKNGTSLRFASSAADFTTFTEHARFSSGGNLLVNSTTDNGNRLQVTGNGYFSGSVGVGTSTISVFGVHAVKSNDSVYFRADSGSVNTYYGSANALGVGLLGTFSNHSLSFYTNSTEKMILNASGNLGLGVQPSAWGSNYKSIDIGSRTSFYSDSDVASIVSLNQYIDAGGRKYKVNGVASFYEQYNGLHAWYTAPSGTAGNAITFTQAMTLTANGRLLLGTTTEGTYAFTINDISGGNLLKITSGSTILDYYVSGGNPSFGTASNHDLRIKTNDVTRLTLASTGAATFSSSVTANGLMVAQTGESVIRVQDLDGTNQYLELGHNGGGSYFLSRDNTSNGNFVWYTSTGSVTERMRITSGGNLLVGTTTDSGEKLQVSGGAYFSGSVGIGVAAANKVSIKNGATQLDVDTTTSSVTLEAIDRANTSNSINFEYYARYGNHVFYNSAYTERMRIKANGSVRYIPMATPGTAEAGDVYYDSTSNKLRCYNGTSWNDLF